MIIDRKNISKCHEGFINTCGALSMLIKHAEVECQKGYLCLGAYNQPEYASTLYRWVTIPKHFKLNTIIIIS